MRSSLYIILLASLLFSCQSRQQIILEEMTGFPNAESGIEQGVSACFAGILDGYLVMAGGCNFPEVPAADGGPKRYYKGIYAARLTQNRTLDWKKVGELPYEVAYGATISATDKLLIIGGNNTSESFSSVYSLTWADHSHTTVRIDDFIDLPYPLDNMAGCLIGSNVYIAGGNKDGAPCNEVLRISLQDVDKGWEMLPPFPGQARIQPVCGGIGSDFYLWGGFDLKTKTLDVDGFRFDEEHRQWKPVSGPTDIHGEPLFTGGGVAVSSDSLHVLIVGGVHKDVFMTGMLQSDSLYMRHPISWYRFNPYIVQYDGQQWEVLTDSQGLTARAGAALVNDRGVLYLVGGELKPGIRSNQVVRIKEGDIALPPSHKLNFKRK